MLKKQPEFLQIHINKDNYSLKCKVEETDLSTDS